MNARETARQAVKSSVVLLKNEGGVLPLPQGAKVALFGWAQWDAVLSGNGSGAARGGVSPSVVDALKAVGVRPAYGRRSLSLPGTRMRSRPIIKTIPRSSTLQK